MRVVLRIIGHLVLVGCVTVYSTGCYSYAAYKQLGSCNPRDGLPVSIVDASQERPVVSWDFKSRAHHEYGGTRRRYGSMRLKVKHEDCERPLVHALTGTGSPPALIERDQELVLSVVHKGQLKSSLPEIWSEDCGLILLAEVMEADSDSQKVRLITVNRYGQVVSSKRVRARMHNYGILPAYLVTDVVLGCALGVVLIITSPWIIYKALTGREGRGSSPNT